jgi:hypothetical protein
MQHFRSRGVEVGALLSEVDGIPPAIALFTP